MQISAAAPAPAPAKAINAPIALLVTRDSEKVSVLAAKTAPKLAHSRITAMIFMLSF